MTTLPRRATDPKGPQSCLSGLLVPLVTFRGAAIRRHGMAVMAIDPWTKPNAGPWRPWVSGSSEVLGSGQRAGPRHPQPDPCDIHLTPERYLAATLPDNSNKIFKGRGHGQSRS